ncbi:MAG: hypothetical protein J6X78_08625 [Treponema sp.]|nr:hypothetical protein [Treponema sp.]
MGKTKHLFLILGVFLCAQACFAKQISIQIVQHDERTDKVTESSLVIEDELLNGFFETGYIITNSPTVVSQSDNDDMLLYNKALGDAYEGSSDYFVQIKLYYKNSLKTVDWTIASVATGRTIKESSFENSSTTDEKGLRKVSSQLVSEITKIIKSTKA